MKGIHAWAYKKPSYGGAGLWFGPLAFRISTGAAAGAHIEFKVRVDIRRTLIIRRDKFWSFKVLAYKGSFPRLK